MLLTHKFHLSGYVVPLPIKRTSNLGEVTYLYPLGDSNNVYLYATMFKGLAFINCRKVTNGETFSKEGIAFNSWEVNQFRKLRPELELAIVEKKSESGVLDCYLGKYKLIRYHIESQLLDLVKIRATDDHQEYGDASIRLDTDEMRAFFGTFDRVYEEFRQLIADLLPAKSLYVPPVATTSSAIPALGISFTTTPTIATTSAAKPSVAASIEKLHQADKLPTPAVATTSQKRKAPVLAGKEVESKMKKRIAALQVEGKVPKLKIDLSKINNM